MNEQKIKVSLRIEMPEREPELRHDIQAELTLLDTIGRGAVVQGEFAQPGAETIRFEAQGTNILAAVLSWLSAVDKCTSYVPAYRTKEGGNVKS